MTEAWEDEGGSFLEEDEEDWPYDDEWEDEGELLKDWDDLDDIDDYQYIEENRE